MKNLRRNFRKQTWNDSLSSSHFPLPFFSHAARTWYRPPMPYWPEWPFPIYWSSPRTFPSPCTTFSIATWVHAKSSPMVGPCSHCSMLTIRWCSTPFPCGWQCCWPCGDTWLSGKCIALQNNILYFLCIFKECVVFSYKFQVVWTPANFKEFCTENLTQSMSLCWRTVQKYSVVLSHSSNFLLDNIHSTKKNNELPIVCVGSRSRRAS